MTNLDSTPAMMNAARQRSKKGCMTCRQKRKKCDELKPRCSRCAQGRDECIWPDFLAQKVLDTDEARAGLYLSRGSPDELPGNVGTSFTRDAHPGSTTNQDINYIGFLETLPGATNPSSSSAMSYESELVILSPPAHIPPVYRSPHHPDHAEALSASRNNYTQLLPHRPKLVPPPNDALKLACWKYAPPRTYKFFELNQDDEEDEFESREWLPEARQSLNMLLKDLGHPQLLEMCDTYILFMARYTFDPSRAVVRLSEVIFERYMLSDSMRHSMLGMSALLRGYYDPKTPSKLMFKQAEAWASTADQLSRSSMQRPDVSLETKLTEIGELMCYYYYSGRLMEYYKYLQLAAPIVKILLGSNVDFHKLSGAETFDIRFFAWCDILAAVATSSPTMVTYVCDFEPLLQANLEGKDRDDSSAGLEWIVGCPDFFTMIMAQIINLHQNRAPQSRRIEQAIRIEEAAQAWIIRPARASSPLLRIERMAVQEIWRHTIILYLYNRIHKASSSHEVVQKSVKQVVGLASTLRSGRNPDCLLAVPYFIAAACAITPKDRHLLRTRLVGIGNEAYLGGLVAALDELWKEAGDTGNRVDWSKTQPPNFMF